MNDAEKREKVMKGLECCAFGDCSPCPYTETRCQEHLCGDALALLKEQEPRWIPVTERLPDEDGDYLVYVRLDEEVGDPFCAIIPFDATVPAFGRWQDQYDPETYGWEGSDFIPFDGVTHWMPLPEPPKEEDDG